jgi:hypothetical protein
MGKVLTYDLEGDSAHKFFEMRLKGVEDHLVFDGDEAEGEFCQRFPQTCMELRGLYSIDDNVLSIYLTDVPEGYSIRGIEKMFDDLVKSSVNMSK